MRKSTYLFLAVLGVCLAGCQDRPAPTTVVAAPAPAASPATTASVPAPPASQAAALPASWLGKWTGPEGTFLTLVANGARYDITIQSLDGPAKYEGTAVGDRIEFMRNGPESIRAGNGKDTGMKWLADKADCLVIKTGEGFCRD